MKWCLFICLFFPVLAWAGSGNDVAEKSAREVMDERLDTLYGSHAEYYAFLDRLQKDVAQKRKRNVARMVQYPITIHMGVGKQRVIYTPMQFTKQYDRIITEKVASAVKKQTYDTLFARDIGLMIGNGEIWFSSVCKHVRVNKQMNCTVKIIAINH